MSTEQLTPPIVGHLRSWRTGNRAEIAGRNVAQILEHPGWDDLLSSIRAYQRSENRAASLGIKTQAEYAAHFGEMYGLDQVDALARGVIEHGRKERSKDV